MKCLQKHKNLAVSAKADLLFPLNKESDLNSVSLSEENEKKQTKKQTNKKNTLNHHRSMQKKHRRKKKLVVALNNKRNMARLQTQELSQLASSMEKIAAAILNKQELVVKGDLKCEEI